MNLTVIAVGRLREKPYRAMADEYIKRLTCRSRRAARPPWRSRCAAGRARRSSKSSAPAIM